MALVDEVNQKRVEIRTDGYAMSIGEWISLYEKQEIDIHPEFQRFFRWTDSQKTNLIESVLLGIPLPPIFVSQRDDGVWDVVDGLQRLSTIFQFLGILRDENENLLPPLTLHKTKYLPSLEGVVWGDLSEDQTVNSLSPELRLIIKRSKISVSIILKESDSHAKYDLFQRLNTGGSQLSPQEVRNCILVMLNKDFFTWIKNLSTYEPFQTCIALSDRPLNESYDLELVLRFIIFSAIDESDLNNIGDVGIFITEKISELATDNSFNRETWERVFRDTFDTLNTAMEDSAFKRYNSASDRFMGGFLLSQYEVVACGLAHNILQSTKTPSDTIRDKCIALWDDRRYIDWVGSGITATRRLPRIIPLGRTLFSNGD